MHSNILLDWEDLGVKAETSVFQLDGKVGECHAVLHVEPRGEDFAGQYGRLCMAEGLLMAAPEFQGFKAVFKRYFLSDSCNQFPVIESMGGNSQCAVSFIQQPPLDGSKVAVWIYLLRGTDVGMDGGVSVTEHNGYRNMWQMGMCVDEGDSYTQTGKLLEMYEEGLEKCGATIADNCIRTWFLVRDVDTQYGGLVKARRENFSRHGLTQDTHYISSTGIGGGPVSVKSLVQMDSFSVVGLDPSQQRYLYAKSHLNPTYEYGVTFERGTLVEYGDRGHVFISGTASIDNRGDVVHVGDVVSQTRRMWENVETLLSEGGMDFSNVMQIIVYLRDVADYETVRRMFAEKFPDTPYVITLAPVCRPTWLIEMECMAVDGRTTEYRDY